MTDIKSPKIVKKKLFSPIWLLPMVALALSIGLGIKSYKEAGIEVIVRFPSAAGIEIGKTLVKYQGLAVGKVIDIGIDRVADIGIDKNFQAVNVSVSMDHRVKSFLREGTQFWLVKPKASITGIEGLDTLFSGNYISIQPGTGEEKNIFDALIKAPAVLPSIDGLTIDLITDSLYSFDVGSQIFYRHIPVGNIVGYRLEKDDNIHITAFIHQQYAYLVKKSSNFWNASGINIDASLKGIHVRSESLSAILAGGIAFSSDVTAPAAENGDIFILYRGSEQAAPGVHFTLEAASSKGIQKGSSIYYRDIEVGTVIEPNISDNGVEIAAKLFIEYAELLGENSLFYLQGPEISLHGIKNAASLITGPIIQLLPGTGEPLGRYSLLEKAPDNQHSGMVTLSAVSDEHSGVNVGAEIRYKSFPIGKVKSVRLSKDLSSVEYQLEVASEYLSLLNNNSYLYSQSALDMKASVDGVAIKTGKINTLLDGALVLVKGNAPHPYNRKNPLRVFSSDTAATDYFSAMDQLIITLNNNHAANLKTGSPVYFKKMHIGEVISISWQKPTNDFLITLGINKKFKSLVNPQAVFWQNSAVNVKANFSGVNVAIAPLKGALKGSISIGHISEDMGYSSINRHLYENKKLALSQAKPISLRFPIGSKLSAHAPIKYEGYSIGAVDTVSLDKNLQQLIIKAYLYGQYADTFTAKDTRYFTVDANISLSGIQAPETLITGPYIGVIPGDSLNKSTMFIGVEKSSIKHNIDKEAVRLTLVHQRLGSIKIGTPILFRGVKIGAVQQYRLSDKGNKLLIFAVIDSEYKHLINRSSKFWNHSGINVHVGLFSGAKINTGSLENILSGGIEVATEFSTTKDNLLDKYTQFILYDEPKKAWKKWQPVLIGKSSQLGV